MRNSHSVIIIMKRKFDDKTYLHFRGKSSGIKHRIQLCLSQVLFFLNFSAYE